MKRLAIFAALALSATSLFASADLTLTNSISVSTVRAGYGLFVFYDVHNNGPDTAANVAVSFTITGATASGGCAAGCGIRDIPAGQSGTFGEQLTFPATAGVVTLTASVSSSSPDPNLADNSKTSTLTVSTDPDVYISVGATSPLDLGLPFSLSFFLVNYSQTDAHDVNVTVTFPTGVVVKTLPDHCASPAPGQFTCHFDTLAAGPDANQYLTVTLVAPPSYGTGSIAFKASATERENDFDPASNTASSVSQLYRTFYVTTTANDGSGSLRQAILDSNATCNASTPCAIGFRIEEPSATSWKTIRITNPLPPVTSPNIRLDGGIQTGLLGDANPDGPEIEISGDGVVDGDGLLISGCGAEVANLVINGFGGNGVSVSRPPCPAYATNALHHLFIGTDPTGSQARPNGERGIGISIDVGSAGHLVAIHDCVISGNTRSGIFDLAGRVNIWGNRIGVKAHSDDPLPNGASGIFIGQAYGSAIGPDVLSPNLPGNVIAFNGESGVAVAPNVFNVSILGNRIWGNRLLGIDIGLDGPTSATKVTGTGGTLLVPTLTLAHYDPVSKKTIIEAEASGGGALSLYANDTIDPSGYGEGQRPIGGTPLDAFSSITHYHVEVDGDLTGQFITGTCTRVEYAGFAKPPGKASVTEGTEQGFLTQTTEFSRAIEVR
ncbi:MAG TPA: hypothetical protein VHX14_11105 [Thermoanaerobaculia bacterium]|jgi:hypothetical protein|nr:hypothetical protein [Thermoanaerobaculia bacterium]